MRSFVIALLFFTDFPGSRFAIATPRPGRLGRRVGSRGIEGNVHAFVSRRAAVFY